MSHRNQSLRETKEVLSWLGKMARHPLQIHKIGESDAEILKISNHLFFCSTVDSIAEEIAYGLYRDPYTMGWMTTMASLSDLAAVGAEPLGLLFSAIWKNGSSAEMKTTVAKGLSDALKKMKTHLLGGDTGESQATVLTGVGLGLCPTTPLTRLGMRPGDWICTTGKMGLGPAFAFQHLLGLSPVILEKDFRPVARVKEGLQLRGLASCSMDTSDGLTATLDTLCKLNGVGVELEFRADWIHEKAKAFCGASKMPLGAVIFGEHGDFELVVAVSPRNLKKAQLRVPGLIIMGKVVKGKRSFIHASEGKKEIHLDLMSELPKKSLDDFRTAVALLVQEAQDLALF